MLISVMQTAEPPCVTVGSGQAVPRNCQNMRSSAAAESRPQKWEKHTILLRAGFLVGVNLKESFKSH